jgi:hypothetical protein
MLFHCNALAEVSGLVYVAASADGYVVCEELEGDYFEDPSFCGWFSGVNPCLLIGWLPRTVRR